VKAVKEAHQGTGKKRFRPRTAFLDLGRGLRNEIWLEWYWISDTSKPTRFC